MKYKLKRFFRIDISKYYVIILILISFLLISSFFSYALFTVTKEKNNAINIVTGTLTYKLLIDGKEATELSLKAGERKDFILTLSNPNSITARFNLYYTTELDSKVRLGYLSDATSSSPPSEKGVNIDSSNSSTNSNTYKIRVVNNSDSDIVINLGVEVGLDYNDLSLPSNGHLFSFYNKTTLSDYLLDDVGENGGLDFTDSNQTFITGKEPNNYVWYSGKLWRAISIDPSDNSIKLVTEWDITALNYASDFVSYDKSYLQAWLNDTTVDGFLGNLREPEKFLKTNSQWNFTATDNSSNLPSDSLLEAYVGSLNIYEYIKCNENLTSGYLNNGLYFWSISTNTSGYVWIVLNSGKISTANPRNGYGIRPAVILKGNIKISAGDGTSTNPYRLEGDDDKDLSGTMLNTRYSGEYISFGVGENNLYRIVSHENGIGTKITSAEPLKNNTSFLTSSFGSNANYNSSNTIGTFLNNDYLNTYLTSTQRQMVEENSVWYLGTVGGGDSYLLAKYNDVNMTNTVPTTTAKVGLLRLGELMGSQTERYIEKNTLDVLTNKTIAYWTLTLTSATSVRYVSVDGNANSNGYSSKYGIKPAMNLKENVIITGGTGTKNDPFQISLSN
ncbi:MAG TPA: hypothetical protein IAB45_03955 [Candidatus Onthousia faecavium]|nr:hypothetical protein [Candidatus Onthousia faecavium]